MSRQASAYKVYEPSAVQTIVSATLIAGSLDIIAAIISFLAKGNKEPIKIFYYIASGIFGKEMAYGSGTWMAFLGLFLHYMIAFIWSVFLFLVYPWLKPFLKNKVVIGLLYGIFVWVIMNRVVLPISNTRPSPFSIQGAIIGCLILMFCIGLPISLIVDRYNRKR
jgi:uncharacterized membrane protein YagU involved in acid resistance